MRIDDDSISEEPVHYDIFELMIDKDYRCLARARWTHEDHVIVSKHVGRLYSVGFRLQNDGL